jgi:hypothetical protein
MLDTREISTNGYFISANASSQRIRAEKSLIFATFTVRSEIFANCSSAATRLLHDNRQHRSFGLFYNAACTLKQ